MTERSAVQGPMLKYAREIGWEYVPRETALRLRGGEAGLYFNEVLEEQLRRLNPGAVDRERAAGIVRDLTLLKPTIAGNRDALDWLRGEHSVFDPREKRERNVALIDFARPEENIFQVTDEWAQKGVAHRNRADVVFLINGIPVAIAETKGAGKRDGMAEGVDQIRRYHRETPELFIAPQVFEVTHLVDFFYGVSWNTSRKNLFNWREEAEGDYERKVKAFFDRPRLLKVLRDYIIFLTRDDELSKIILRQHQTRAVEKVLERIADPTKRRGLVWHTQGSGKTLTMLTIAARLLRETRDGEKPTVLMLVDRNELEAQLFRNITGYGIGTVEVAQSKRDLQRILASDYRGLVVSIIHKFDDIPANVNPRAGIVVLVDEVHRTTGGGLGNYLLGALPNATYIGFTGTPVDNIYQGNSTFKVFGPDDPQGYLDKYSIAESITDGTTVQLNYALAPSELRVDAETLDTEFLGLSDAEGLSDIEETNALLDRAVVLKELMKSPGRVAMIAAYVAEHFRAHVEPMGFKAFLVGVDREACALYKRALDAHLPPEYSRVVYSPAHNDSAALKEFYLAPDDEKQVRRDFISKEKQPKILIVTEKLLTGFDAPILYCMYLDKPMRDHVLLQAIARVNRPYEDESGQVKPYGFVLDFVGIFERLESALAFDSDMVTAVIQNIDVLKNLFAKMMEETAPRYLPLAYGWDDKAKERALDALAEKDDREAFYQFFKQLQNLYDVLSPDVFLRPWMDNYLLLAELYAFVRDAYSGAAYVDREVTAKTRALLRQHTVSSDLTLPGAIHQLGAKELIALKQSVASDTARVLNLRKVLAVTVQQEGAAKPFLLSIGQRAEALAQLYEDRHLTTQQALFEFEKLSLETVEADAEQQRLGLDANTFAIYTAIRVDAPGVRPADAGAVDALFARYPEYEWNEQQQRALRADLYKALRPLVGAAMLRVTDSLLGLRRA